MNINIFLLSPISITNWLQHWLTRHGHWQQITRCSTGRGGAPQSCTRRGDRDNCIVTHCGSHCSRGDRKHSGTSPVYTHVTGHVALRCTTGVCWTRALHSCHTSRSCCCSLVLEEDD